MSVGVEVGQTKGEANVSERFRFVDLSRDPNGLFSVGEASIGVGVETGKHGPSHKNLDSQRGVDGIEVGNDPVEVIQRGLAVSMDVPEPPHTAGDS